MIRSIMLLALLSACSHIDRKVEGWPQDLKQSEVLTTFGEVQSKCWADLPFIQKLMLPVILACTVVDLDKGTCVIYRFGELSPEVREHEEAHCQGYAHDDGFQNYYDAWKSKLK